jgi:hypothetical protein
MWKKYVDSSLLSLIIIFIITLRSSSECNWLSATIAERDVAQLVERREVSPKVLGSTAGAVATCYVAGWTSGRASGP